MNHRRVINKRPYEEEVQLKTKEEILRLSRAGHVVARILKELESAVRPGTTTGSIEALCCQRVVHYSRKWKIERFPEFPTFLSISVNDIAAHGSPGEYMLRTGDLVTLDLVLRVNGWYGDSATTVPVGMVTPEHAQLIRAARCATTSGIAQAKAGGRIGDIGAEIAAVAGSNGCNVIENLIGHGIGRNLHEGPAVYSSGELGVGAPIVPGMVFTIEPVLTTGYGRISAVAGQPAYRTDDHCRTALFEHTVAVLSDRTLVLTGL
jgi:methionyl aminopeptidase